MYVLTFFTGIALALSLVLELFKRFPLCYRVNTKIKNFFHWNFVIRLVLEGALEISFCAYINLKYGTFDSGIFGSWCNYISTVILTVALICLPFWIAVFYTRRFDELQDEEFEHKYGAVYEGLRQDTKWMLAYPIYFIIRRSLFMVAAFVLFRIVIVQLAFKIIITMIAAIYIIHA